MEVEYLTLEFIQEGSWFLVVHSDFNFTELFSIKNNA